MRLLTPLLAGLALVGLVALGLSRREPPAHWGYTAATLAFLLSAGQMAPVLALVSRLARGTWGAPLRRIADLLGLTGLVSAPVLLLLLFNLPDWHERPSIWFDWPGAPLVWDGVAGVGLALAGVALAWLATRPDRAGGRWAGTACQWQMHGPALVLLGSLYTLLVVFVHLLVSSDLALSLVPGWHSAVIPAYHAVSGFQSAVALVVVLFALLQWRAPAFAVPDHLVTGAYHACARLLLALALLWFYFVWCELLTYWYGRTPAEQGLLSLFVFGPGLGLFLVSAACLCVIPFGVLLWNGARHSPRAITVVAAVVLLGSYVDRLRLYVAAWAVVTPTATEHLPDPLLPLRFPSVTDTLACLGTFAAAALVMRLVFGRVPWLAAWDVRATARLTPERRMLRTRVAVAARPS